MPKYQLINDPSIIVEAVQFDPHKQPWPDGVHSWDGKPRPRDMSWGYTDTVTGRVHVLTGDYIVEDYLGGRRVYHCKSFEESFRPIPLGIQIHNALNDYIKQKDSCLKTVLLTSDGVLQAMKYEAKIEAIVTLAEKLDIELT